MQSLNKVTIIGRLGRDPESRMTQDGKEVVNLAVATSEIWKDKATGERKERTEWTKVVILSDGLVKVAKSYLKKGSRVYLEGMLSTRKWTDQAGIERYTTEVVLKGYDAKLMLLDKAEKEPDAHSKAKANAFQPGEMDDEPIF